MAEHSALPWVVWSVENEAGTKWSVCHHVGGLGSETHECVATIKGVDAETAEATARFICQCVNSHHELLAALKELRAVVKGECPSLLNEDSGGDAVLDIAINDAIAKAEGK